MGGGPATNPAMSMALNKQAPSRFYILFFSCWQISIFHSSSFFFFFSECCRGISARGPRPWRGCEEWLLRGRRFGRATLFSWAAPSATLELVCCHLLKAKSNKTAERGRRFSTVLNVTPCSTLRCKTKISTMGHRRNKDFRWY